jgi:predicted dienelactone hydrolase
MLNRIFFLIGTLSLFILSGCEKQNISVLSENSVGLMRLKYSDPIRKSWNKKTARPLVTYIWYPAQEGAPHEEIGIPPNSPVFIGGLASRNAEIRNADKQYPLIMMSHGTGGAGMQMMWLGRALAEKGYIVAAVDHHGNTAAEDSFDARGFRLPWERAKDITQVLNLLLKDPKFGPSIDKDKIGAVGFSLGGYTMVALAGGQTDIAGFERFCASVERDSTCDDQNEYPKASMEFEKLKQTDPYVKRSLSEHGNSFADPRISSFIALAPALGHAFSQESLEAIHHPFFIISGSADATAPIRTNANYLAEHIPNAKLSILTGPGHYIFLNPCNKRGKKYVPVCKDPDGVSRSKTHLEVVQAVEDYFSKTLTD